METEELFRKLKPVLGKRIDALWVEYQLEPDSRRDIEGLLHILASKHLGRSYNGGSITLVPPTGQQATGEYVLGTVHYGETPLYEFGLREYEWIQHVGIFGRTGSGKTNVGFLIVKKLIEKSKPFLVFDWKRNYRDLLTLPEVRDITVYTVGRDVSPFRFNPLIPPTGTPPTTWLKKLIEIMCHVYWLGEGVAYLLQKAIDSVYRQADAEQHCPTMQDVKVWLESYKTRGRASQWMESALRLVGTLCYGEIGKVLNIPQQNGLEAMLRQNVILELDALTNNDKTFLIESLLLWIHHYRLQEPEREKFKHAIIIEEAHHVLLKHEQSKESVVDVILREIRELGESMVMIDQHPSLISIPSLGNTYTTIVMNLKHARDIATLGEAMLLGQDEREYLGRLEQGFGIVKLQGRCPKSFLVGFPLVNIKKGSVDDQMLRSRFPTNSTSSQEIALNVLKQEVIPPVPNGDKVVDLMSDERCMLVDVMQHAIDGVAERYRRLGLNPRRGSQAISSLVSKFLLSSDFVSTPEGRVRFLQVTEQGASMMNKLGYEYKLGRRGGPEHEYWKYRVGEIFETTGFQVELEHRTENGGSIDLVACRGGENLAIEIETGNSEVCDNITRDLRGGYSQVICVSLSSDVTRELTTSFSEDLSKGRLIITATRNLLESVVKMGNQ